MSVDPLTDGIDAVKTVIDKIFPDKNEALKHKLKIQELHDSGKLEELKLYTELMLAQIDVNKAQAQHPSLFVAGARPFVIWSGGLSLAWAGIIHPLLVWVWAFCGIEGSPPALIESSGLTAIVTGLLGFGSMRSYDKLNGRDTKSIK